MARYLGPKNHVACRFGANIFGRSRNPLLRKPNSSGQHGVQRKKKSDYGFQLEEKQKLKACYGMLMEKQVKRAFKEASTKHGNTAQIFIERLECRLDNVVYRLGLARTIFAAQQLVAHGHITVNGKKVDRRSFFVKPGMVISIREKSRKMKALQEAIDTKSGDLPSYMEFDKSTLKGSLISVPQWEQIEAQLPIPINLSIVCEFLAHQS